MVFHFVLTLWMISHWPGTVQTSAVKDYCLYEYLNTTCDTGELVVMETARYGRMRPGRCISGEGNMGCMTDVLPYFDSQCSGRHHCAVSIRNLVELQPCRKDYIPYLEASYSCIQVLRPDTSQCHSTAYVSATAPSGYLTFGSSQSAGNPTPGSPDCPWQIEVEQGRRINLTLYDFNTRFYINNKKPQDGAKPSRSCSSTVFIVEGSQKSTYRACQKQARVHHSYTSNGSKILVYMTGITKDRSSKGTALIMNYQAIGCADPVVPADMWVMRAGHNLVIRCNSTDETWYLTCKSKDWVGDIGNCSKGFVPRNNEEIKPHFVLPTGIIVAVLVGVVLGVLIGSILLVVLHCFRKRQREESSKEANLNHFKLVRTSQSSINKREDRAISDQENYPALLKDVEHADRTAQYVERFCLNSQYGELERIYETGTHPLQHDQRTTSPSTQCFATGTSSGQSRRHLYECPQYPYGMPKAGFVPMYYELDQRGQRIKNCRMHNSDGEVL